MGGPPQTESPSQGTQLAPKGRRALEARVVDLTDYEVLETEAGVDLRAWGHIIRKRLSTILIVCSLVFVVGAIATLKQKFTYRAQVVLEIQKENPDIPTIQELYQLESVSDDYLKTQYSILASKSLAKQVIDQLHLDTVQEFNAPPWWSLQLRHGPPASNPSVTSFIAAQAANSDRALYQRVLERFQDHLTIDPVSHSRLVAVNFDSHDPDLAARVANSLAADYIEQSLQARWTAAQTAADWLSQQLSGVKVKLERSEDDLQDYTRQNGLIFLQNDKGTIQNVANDRLQQLQDELTKAQADRYSKEVLYRLVQAGDYSSLPGVFENRMLQDLTVRLTDLKRQRAQLLATFSPDYPRVKEAQNQIDELESSLQRERKRAADQITNEYLAASNREALVHRGLVEQQNEVNLIAEKSVQYNILRREVDTNRQVYESLLQQLKAAGLSANLRASNIRVVDPAEPPAKPIKPRVLLNMLLAVILGLGLGAGTAVLQERLDDTIKDADDVERLLGLSTLALIPAVRPLNGDHRGLHKLSEPTNSIAPRNNGNGSRACPPWYRIDVDGGEHRALVEAFRGLRTSILLSNTDCPPRSLLITSTQPGEGKTTIAGNLAIALVQVGQRVLLVDADLRSPSVHRLFGKRNDLGLVSYLAGHQEWPTVIRPSGTPGLDLLLCGPVPPNPSELLSSRRMGTFIESAKEKYDHLILDSAPMLALADSRILASSVSGVLLVVKNRTIPQDQVLHAQTWMQNVGGRVLGVVLNNVDLSTRGYYDYGPQRSMDSIPCKGISVEGDDRSILARQITGS